MAAALVALALATPVEAQTCLGRSSFRDGWFQVLGRGVFNRGDGRSLRVGFASRLGGPVFGGLSYTRSNSRPFANVLSSQVGLDFAGGRVAFCPLAELSMIGGGDDARYVTNGISLEAGGHIGIVAADTGRLRVIPTVGVRMYYLDLDYDFASTSRNPDNRSTGTSGLVQAGLGIVFSQRMSVSPILRFNVTSDDAANPGFLLSIAFNFGG